MVKDHRVHALVHAEQIFSGLPRLWCWQVIVENTLQAAAQNEEKIQARKNKETELVLNSLKAIFEEADEDRSGSVDKEEFCEILDRQDVRRRQIVQRDLTVDRTGDPQHAAEQNPSH